MKKDSIISAVEPRPWFLQSRLRLLGTLFFILAVPTAILTLLITVHVRQELRDQAIQQNLVTAQLVATSVGEEFYGLRKYVENFARRSKVVEFTGTTNTTQLRGKLAEMVAQNAKVSRAFATDTVGDLIADYPFTPSLVKKNFADRDWFIGAASRRDAYVSEIYRRVNVDGAYVLTICSRILNSENNTIGYLGGQLTTDRLARWLEKLTPTATHKVILLDRSGQPALRADGAEALTRNSEFRETLGQKDGWLFIQDAGAVRHLASYVRIPSIGWTAVAFQSADNIFAPVNTLLKTIAVFFVLCLLGMVVVGSYWFNTLSRYEARRENADIELKNYATNLKRSNDELQALCYSIAHDLRGPLRAIRGLAIALREDYAPALDEVGRDYVDRLEASAGRMDDLTKDLLDYGRLSHVELVLQPVSLQPVIEKALLLFVEEVKSKGAQIEVKQPLPMVRSNPLVLEQVISNLVSNSLKFVKADTSPRIEISAEENEKTVLLRIRDNGIGIDPAHHKRIFGVFERLHDDQAFPGTGIGLAIVRKGIERLGGQIGVESKAGEGSCFWLELPKAALTERGLSQSAADGSFGRAAS